MRALALAAVGLLAGGIGHLAGRPAAADLAFTLGAVAVLFPALVRAARGLARGETGGDVIAVLAMAGALALSEHLAAAILAVMLAGGGALEELALARANRELTALLARSPRVAHVRRSAALVDVPADDVRPGDLLAVKAGEVVPTDAVLVSESAQLDRSSITGESRPVTRARGALIESGALSVGSALEARATVAVAQSTYAAIVRLVESASATRAPLVRLADAYAGRFLWIALALAGAAWAWSGTPERALAVLVVATPCPLLLAAPAAIAGGMSRAARAGILVKGGGALETLARTKRVLLDKTGTLTRGRPRVLSVKPLGDMREDELVRLAAAVDQLSMHPFAPALVDEAGRRGLDLPWPADASEALGAGVEARVEGRVVRVGKADFAAPGALADPRVRAVRRRATLDGTSPVFVAVDGALAGALVLADPIRPEAPASVRELRRAGVERVDIVTGDHPDVAELVGDAVGADRVWAERTPADKVDVVRRVRAGGVTVMVGDGVNDAPALALADVGVAMGARGASAASEAADVVLTGDRLGGLVLALAIARRTRSIAVQSIAAGMGLSLVAMLAAAAGLLRPVEGAILQEFIDLAVIANALRTLASGGLVARPTAPMQREGARLELEHRTLAPRVEALGNLAARLDLLPARDAVRELESARAFLEGELLPHEKREQATAYPLIAAFLGDRDPTGPLVHTHHEIARRVRLFARQVDALDRALPDPVELEELRGALAGLHAILALHFAQEDEIYSAAGSAAGEDSPSAAFTLARFESSGAKNV